jgi:hypothetical protein
MRLSLVLISLVGLTGDVWAGPQKAGQKCGKPSDCAVGLQCGIEHWKCFDPSQAENNKCRAHMMCKLSGWCTFDKSVGRCTATSNADCRASTHCRQQGTCGLWQDSIHHQGAGPVQYRLTGSCLAVSAKDCRASVGCKVFGNCGFKTESGYCTATSNADCRASWQCRDNGQCRYRKSKTGGECVK